MLAPRNLETVFLEEKCDQYASQDIMLASRLAAQFAAHFGSYV